MAWPWGAFLGRLCRWSALAIAGALAMAGSASATTLTPSPDPLPDSTFQGGDGDQDNTATLMDWGALQAAGRVRHRSDPNTADSAFAGASREENPGGWDLATEADGVDPAKANIRDAWSVVDQAGANTFLYLAFAREDSGGTTAIVFELNRDTRLWDNGNARIPCRRDDDVQIAYEPQGNRVDVVVRRWDTAATDSATGCATRGAFVDATDLTPDTDVQGAVNGDSIQSRLPGFYDDSVPPYRFGETSLNLAAIIDEAFGENCLAFASMWMYSRSAASEQSNMRDYVRPRGLSVRTCSASGTKFFDSNANGQRDRGERGIPRFLIWADYDNDGFRDRGEPFSVSDNQGQYVIHDIQPPRGVYWLREKLLTRRSRTAPVALDWRCSYPDATADGGTGTAPDGRFGCAWGPINVATDPDVRGRDFGNWFPARLTLTKQLSPETDPGRFDLLVNGRTALAAAGNGGTVTLDVPPGTYDVSERAAGGTDAAAYRSSVTCSTTTSSRSHRRSGPVYEDLVLRAGRIASCTFLNHRPGAPAIAIDKTGPETATAGDTINYTLVVTNPGDVAIPASTVVVRDDNCDDLPELVSKGDDSTPRTLDPGDEWTYRCSHQTSAGGDCEPTRLPNTGFASGTAGGVTVNANDSISTILLCPDQPKPPIPTPPPGPTPGPGPGPVVPTGPRPPNAGDAAVAGLLFKRATQGCIGARVPRVVFRGTRIMRIRVFVNGREDRRLTVRTLQRRFRPRVRVAPGTYRIAVRVLFQRGSGTPPVTLRGRVAICGRAGQPRFTG
jgi:hypothetical protein